MNTSNIPKIPRIIMQTWKTRDVPEKWHQGQKSIIKLNPDWQYVLMTDKDNLKLIETHFPQYLKTYQAFEHNIQRVDFIRYAWMYLKGGIYIDLDYHMYKSFDELLFRLPEKADIYMPLGGVKSSMNAFLISRPKCQFWIELMDLICRNEAPWYSQVESHLQVLYSTGPGILISALQYYGHKYKVVFIPDNIFPMCSACALKCETEFGKKLEGCSWVNSSGQILMFCFCNLYQIFAFLILIIAAVFLITMYCP